MADKLFKAELTFEELRAAIEYRRDVAKKCIDCGSYKDMDAHIARIKQLWKIIG